MVSLEEAKHIFEELVRKAPDKYEIQQIQEVQFDDPIYVMIALDKNGEQIFPGDVFPSILKETGELIDYSFPCPA